MTLVASLLFLSALAASSLTIARTIRRAMPRIVEIIEAEFEPVVLTQRKVTFGVVRVQQRRSAEILALRQSIRVEREYQLAA